MRGFVALFAVIALCGCENVNPDIGAAEQYVRDHQKDPGATQFRNVTMCNNGVAVKGEVLGKNSYGAYTGWRKFYATSGSATLEADDNVDDMAREEMDCVKSPEQWERDVKSATDKWKRDVYKPLNETAPN